LGGNDNEEEDFNVFDSTKAIITLTQISMRNITQAKGNKSAAIFGSTQICQFFRSAKNVMISSI
jgi:hypothetical protein